MSWLKSSFSIISVTALLQVLASPPSAEPIREFSDQISSGSYILSVTVPSGHALKADETGTRGPDAPPGSKANISTEPAVFYYDIDWKMNYRVDVTRNPDTVGTCKLGYSSAFEQRLTPQPKPEDPAHLAKARRILKEINLREWLSIPLIRSDLAKAGAESLTGPCGTILKRSNEQAAEIEGALRNVPEELSNLMKLSMLTMARMEIPGAEVTFETEASMIPITIVGGNVDQVMMATYRALDRLGLLGNRKIRLHDLGISLADHLYRTRVLHSRYPALFDDFLSGFDDSNRLIYQHGDHIIVPDLKLSLRESSVQVTLLGKTSLYQRVRNLGLYRTIDEKTGRHIPLEDNWKKIFRILSQNSWMTERLNLDKDWPSKTKKNTSESLKLRKEIGRLIARLTRGDMDDDDTLSFPADVFHLYLPLAALDRNSDLPEVQVLLSMVDKENVYTAGQTSRVKTETVARLSETAVLARPSVAPANLSLFPDGSVCKTDHHVAHTTPHLNAIGIHSKNHDKFKVKDGWVAVIDKFGIPSEVRQAKELERTFFEIAQAQGREAAILWNATQQRFNLSDEQLGAQVDKWTDEDFLEFYLLREFHDEFKETPSANAPIVADPNTHPFADRDHGFHVASVIAGKCNSFGIVGVAPMMKIHAYDGLKGGIDSEDALEDYFRHSRECKKPCIVNASFSIEGERNLTPLLKKVLEKKEYTNGVLVVAAAGQRWKKGPDGKFDNLEICKDQTDPKTWRAPACLGNMPNVLTVTSARFPKNAGDAFQIQPDANYSTDLVWLAAPGIDVLGATANPQHYVKQDGTSIAAGFVTGTGAVIKSLMAKKQIEMSPCQIKARLAYSADLNVGLSDRVKFGWLNAGRAVENLNLDVVKMATGKPEERVRIGDLGFNNFEVYEEKHGKWPDDLYIYEDRDYTVKETADAIALSDVRRLVRNKNGSFTLVYADSSEPGQPCGNLVIRRNIWLWPRNHGPNFMSKKRLNHSFGIVTREGAIPSNLQNIEEVIVRASMK